MGRHHKYPLKDGQIVNDAALGDRQPRRDIEERLGLHKQVCQSCNCRNPQSANKCRKCGAKNLRDKKYRYHDDR